MSIDYVGNTPPVIPVPPKGALYYDEVHGVLYAAVPGLGQWFVIGGGSIAPPTPVAVPVILTSEAFTDTTTTHAISITAPETQMYALSIYMDAVGTGSSGHTITATVNYTAADGSGAQAITLILPLGTPNVVMETYPLLALGGTAISATTAYGGAYADPYTIGASIVQMPVDVD